MTTRASLDSFGTRSALRVGDREFEFFDLTKLERRGLGNLHRLPFCMKVLLENLLRHEDGKTVTAEDIEALLGWDAKNIQERELAFSPARVLLQDFTGVPALVDLAAMREAMANMGGDPSRINPLIPSELVIDHSVQVDSFGSPNSFHINVEKEFERNRERYTFLRWGQAALDNFRVVPPATGIVHQVNLEYLARVVFGTETDGRQMAYPDTLVGTDSHTTMINGLGVLGWGVGGIEAEAAMLGQPISLLIPQVVGFKLYGTLPEGATATDLVLTVTERLRQKGVVGKFVEFYGPGVSSLSLADRATIGNMSPEYGATCAILPVDRETLAYLRLTARTVEQVALVESYCKAQTLFHTANDPEADYTDTLELDVGQVEPSLAGPKRPQDRIPLRKSKQAFQQILLESSSGDATPAAEPGSGAAAAAAALLTQAPPDPTVQMTRDGQPVEFPLGNGSIVIAAITSCTNTSNPSVMVGAGLLAKKAVQKGLQSRPWVKTSLAPGSKVVTEYLQVAGLLPYLDQLGFNLVGYGCTTCIGNSGPLPEAIARAIEEHDLVACAVLSGNRNFEGRINAHVRANYLASPPLVVAYALAGRMDVDLYQEPLGTNSRGQDIYLSDIWPTPEEVGDIIQRCVTREMFAAKYTNLFAGDESWRNLAVPQGDRYDWDTHSTYIKHPPFFEKMPREAPPVHNIRGMKVLALLGDSITTDHISPASSIPQNGPAGHYLVDQGVKPFEFNSFGSRRGNHEVMMRGTFANIRLRNLLAPGTEGGYTMHPSSSQPTYIYDAAMKYGLEGTPLLVLAGKEYGSGSSRDWAAKGTRLLGVAAVLAESFERIHRSNLIGMGTLPLQFDSGQNPQTLGLTGEESFDVLGLDEGLEPGKRLTVRVWGEHVSERTFSVRARVDTPNEVHYYRHGGILPFVLRKLLDESPPNRGPH